MDALDALCRTALGAGIAHALFHERATHDVHGLRLTDGREVVVKLHGPRMSPAFLVAGLARLVTLARPRPGLEQQPLAVPAGDVFPQPLDGGLRLDTPGGEWIDAIAARARPARDAPVGGFVVGHLDWRAEHLRLHDGELSALYDWDIAGGVRRRLRAGARPPLQRRGTRGDPGRRRLHARPHRPLRARRRDRHGGGGFSAEIAGTSRRGA